MRGLFIRLAWMALAGTYRIATAAAAPEAGQHRFAPSQLADKQDFGLGARLLWPIKQKYGRKSPGPTYQY